jgi:ABC-type dipeptide/oligopeptide/nickel transport system permease subunit
MEGGPTLESELPGASAPRSRWQVRVCAALLATYALVAVAGWLHLLPDAQAVVGGSQLPPSATSPAGWCGTDLLGRSVLWRVLAGTQTAMTIGLATVAVALPLGFVLGLVAGWYGGWVDEFVGWLYSVVVSVPGVLLVTAIAYAMGRGLIAISVALGATEWVAVMRLVRGEVLKHREMDYVLAARVGGASTLQILFGEIAPNVVHLAVVWSTLVLVTAVKYEVVLTYLGLGVQDGASWGLLIAGAAQDLVNDIWWPLATAVIAMFGLIYSLSVIGDALRDAWDPRLADIRT